MLSLVRSTLIVTLITIFLMFASNSFAQTDLTVSDAGRDTLMPLSPIVKHTPNPLEIPLPLKADTIEDFLPQPQRVQRVQGFQGQIERTISLNPSGDSAIFNDRVGVMFEDSTFQQPVAIEFTEILTGRVSSSSETTVLTDDDMEGNEGSNDILDSTQSTTLLQFQIDVINTADGAIIHEFEKQVRLILDVRNISNFNPETHNLYLSYEDEENPGEWIDVPTRVFQEDGLLVADVDHFSAWSVDARPEQWALSWNPPAVSQFSGAATYGYPIEVPPGRNGMQPSVSLSYNSRSIDGAIGGLGANGDVAHGWNLAESKIIRDGVNVEEHLGRMVVKHPDRFRLTLNGTGYELVPDNTTPANNRRYYVEDNPSLKVYRRYQTGIPNYEKLYWIVTTPDGTAYRFGYTANAEEYHQANDNFRIDSHIQGHQGNQSGDAARTSATAWRVDTVTDIFGNQMVYEYKTVISTDTYTDPEHTADELILSHQRVRLSHIAYNFPNRQSISNGHIPTLIGRFSSAIDDPATVIYFAHVRGSQNEWETASKVAAPISRIAVYHAAALDLNVVQPNREPLAEYRLEWDGTGVARPANCAEGPTFTHTNTIASITRHAQTDDDLKTDDTGVTLPATTFTYAAKSHTNTCYLYKYLVRVDNGYGGYTRFEYDADGRTVTKANPLPWLPDISIRGYNYFVTNQFTGDGRGNEAEVSYAYTAPCYNQTELDTFSPMPGAFACGDASNPTTEEYGPLVGFDTTTVSMFAYDGTLLMKSETDFHQIGINQGKPETQATFNHDDIQLSLVTTTYQELNFGGTNDDLTEFSREKIVNTQQFAYDFHPTNKIETEQRFFYDTGLQNDEQLGNMTVIQDYGNKAILDDDRTILRKYEPVTSVNYIADRWQPSLMVSERVFPGLVGSAAFDNTNNLSESRTIYDAGGSSSCTAGAVLGVVCQTQVGKANTTIGGAVGGFITTQEIGYDVYGNAVTTKDTREVMNGDGVETIITYDSSYHLYPIHVAGYGNNETWFEYYDFHETTLEYASFSAVGGNSNYHPNGQLKSVKQRIDNTDANKALSSYYEFDPFGRLHAVYSDALHRGSLTNALDGDPVQRILYFDNAWIGAIQTNPAGNQPFQIMMVARPESFTVGSSPNEKAELKSVAYHDGLGRVIQTQERNINVSDASGLRDRIVSTDYDARGLTTCQTVPYDRATFVSGSISMDTTNCTHSSLDQTLSTYDDRGRIRTITAPDGSVSEHFYGMYNKTGIQNLVTNNYSGVPNYRTDSVTDSMPNEWYNVHRIVDAKNHQTTQIMNGTGQLVYVTEHTGTSSYARYATTAYGYDLQGNLVRVIDEKDNLSKMTYDTLGRKIEMNDPDMGTWTYAYDESGSLVRQTDAKDNHLCFYYDEQSRMLAKTTNATSSCPPTAPSSLTAANLLAYHYYDSAQNGLGQPVATFHGNTGDNYDINVYDTRGRLSQQVRRIGNQWFTQKLSDYDALDRPLTIEYPNGDKAEMMYDREGEDTLQLRKADSSLHSLVTGITYNERGQVASVNRANGKNTIYDYWNATGINGNSNFRLKQALTAGINDFTYSYDTGGNILTVSNAVGSDNQVFTYDHLNRLMSASATGGNLNDNYNLSYAYDEIGNLTGRDGSYIDAAGQQHINVDWDYDYSGNQPHAVGSIDVNGNSSEQTYAYDENGNMAHRFDGDNRFVQRFDAENRLIQVTTDADPTFLDTFDTKDTSKWIFNANQTVPYASGSSTGNVIQSNGTGSSWSGNLRTRDATIEDGDSASVEFEVNGTSTNFRAALITGSGSSYGEWGIRATNNKIYVRYRENGSWTTAKTLITPLKTNTRYVLTLSADDVNGFHVDVYEKDNPEIRGDYTFAGMPSGQAWRFRQWIYSGTALLDNYVESDTTRFYYDSNGQRMRTIKSNDAEIFTPFPGYDKEVQPATQTPLGNLGLGIACQDNATGTGFIMFSKEPVYARFASPAPHAANADHLICVTHQNDEWVYDNNGSYTAFEPVLTDRLIAFVSFSSDWVIMLSGQRYVVKGVQAGYASGDVVITANMWGGSANSGEFGVTGTQFTLSALEIERVTLSLAGQAIAVHVTDDNGRDDINYIFSDHLGSSSVVTDQSGNTIIDRSQHLPFGGMRGGTPDYLNDVTDMGFTGHKENSDIGLTYMNARFYVPGIGRFASADFFQPQLSTPQTFNRFAYVLNNPIALTDPTGMFCYDNDTNDFSEGTCYDAEQSFLLNRFINWYESGEYTNLELAEMLISLALDIVSNPVAALRAASEIVREDAHTISDWEVMGFEYSDSKWYVGNFIEIDGNLWDDSGFGNLAEPPTKAANQITHFIGIAYIGAFMARGNEIDFGENAGGAKDFISLTLIREALVIGNDFDNPDPHSKDVEIRLGRIAFNLGVNIQRNSEESQKYIGNAISQIQNAPAYRPPPSDSSPCTPSTTIWGCGAE